MTYESWLIFVTVWTASGLVLGPNALNCMAVASANGFRKSMWAILGILIASFAHITAVALGVAAVLLANAWLFSALKLCGAAYLVWMGISLWRNNAALPDTPHQKPLCRATLVRNAFFISMSNPKAIVCYLAVFSQFINPGAALAPQLVMLVPTAMVITVCIYIFYSALGLGFRQFLGTARRRLVFNRSVGAFYIFAGMALAASDYQPPAPKRT